MKLNSTGTSFRKKNVESEETSLNITAMADIFTIILVFLLKSFSTSAMNLSPATGLQLPQALAAENNVEALKVEILEDSVLLEGIPVSTLSAFQFSKRDLVKNGSSRSLGDAIKKNRKKQMAIAKGNEKVKVDGKILVLADQRVPYHSIKTVLASAAVHGYTDFKLAVLRPE